MSREKDGKFQPAYRVLSLVWLGMVGALCVYVAFGLAFGNQFDTKLLQPPSVQVTIRRLFFLVSVLQLVLAFTLRRAFFRQQAHTFGMPDGETECNRGISRYQTIVIGSLALAESPGLFGLVYLVLSKDTHTFLIFVALAAVAMLALRPNRNELQQFVTRGRSAR